MQKYTPENKEKPVFSFLSTENKYSVQCSLVQDKDELFKRYLMAFSGKVDTKN